MGGWSVRTGLVGLSIAVCLFGSSLPAAAVTGGTEVDAATFASDWSFTVGVGRAHEVFCTGSLVNASTVITAGHCVDPADSPDTVFYGSRDYTNASTVAIASIERNPNYAHDATGIRNDSAILHLAEPVTGVSPIRVATAADEAALGASVSARFAGFGLTEGGIETTRLHAATGAVTTTTSGSADWLLSGGRANVCQGDSGGPLVARLPTTGEDVLIGATSWGPQYCPSTFGLWTDLGRDDFIQDAFYPGSGGGGDGGVTATLVNSESSTTGPAPLTVTFDLTGSNFSDGRAVTYYVDPTLPPTCAPDTDPSCDPSVTSSPNAITSSTPVMQFTYTQPGAYTAMVKIDDPNSPDVSDASFVEIVVSGPSEPPPTATLVQSVSPTTGSAPLAVTFDLTGSSFSDGRAPTYLVDPTLCDSVDLLCDPLTAPLSENLIISENPVMRFTYTQDGTYTALVGFIDPNDQSLGAFAFVTITVGTGPVTVSPAAAPPAEVGVPWTASFHVLGGTPPYTVIPDPFGDFNAEGTGIVPTITWDPATSTETFSGIATSSGRALLDVRGQDSSSSGNPDFDLHDLPVDVLSLTTTPGPTLTFGDA